MLEQIGTFYQTELKKLADVWLAAGANSFGLRSIDHPIAEWSAESNDCTKSVIPTTAPICHENRHLGEIFVTGLSDDWVDTQLKSNAIFIAQLVAQEQELESMTQELVDSQDQLVALYDLLHSTRNLVSVTEIVEGIVLAIGKIFEVSTTFIWGAFLGQERWVAMHLNPLPDSVMAALVEHTLNQPGYFLFSDIAADVPDDLKPVNCALAIPLTIQDEAVAVLGVVNKKAGDFESPEIKLLRAIGKYVESEIENALMHEANIEQVKAQTRLQTEMELAHDVQMNLLPQALPDFPTLDLAAKALPALSVGGDFYDYLVQINQQFYFTLGDVSGKGMSAALLMAMTRTTMRNTARLLEDPTPELILDRTTEALYDDFTEVSMFATVFVGAYCLETERLRYANAGHAPVIYRPAEGRARLLEATGPPLGSWPENLASESSIPFGVGDVLVVATDGLNEATNNDKELFDIERLLQLVDELADQCSSAILEGLLDAVGKFSEGHPQEDDQTAIVMKRALS